jgi:DNA-binding response OmpR family regulator
MEKRHAILVVDDDESIGFMLKLMLEHKGFSVTVAERAENLEQLITANKISLVILDMLIADVKGTDVCAELKSKPATAHLPVIMMTALPGIEKECQEAGADDFIAKPFEMDTFLAKINSFIV